MFVNRKGIEIEQLFSLEMALNTHGKGFSIPKLYQIVKSEQYEVFCVSRLLILRQDCMGRRPPASSSLFVECRQVG